MRAFTAFGGLRHAEVPHPHQIVGSNGNGEDPLDHLNTSIVEFSKTPYCLGPAKYFLDPLPLALADLVANMRGGSTVDG